MEILQREGHSTDGLNYIEHFYSPKSQNKSRDYYSVTFYRSAKDNRADWVHAIQFSADGQMYKMYTRTAERQNNTNNNDPAAADADSGLLGKARQAARAYMERYGYSSLAGLADRMQLSQISVSEDKQETYYSFVAPDSEFLITILKSNHVLLVIDELLRLFRFLRDFPGSRIHRAPNPPHGGRKQRSPPARSSRWRHRGRRCTRYTAFFQCCR